MDNSLEDGELSNDSDCYIPLKRPDNYSSFSSAPTKAPALSNDSCSPENSSSDSGSDSDGAVKQKRPKLKPRPRRVQTKPVNDKYNLWSNRLQEEVLVDTLNTCDVTKKDRSRDVESYDYPVRESYGDDLGECDLRKLLSRKGEKRGKDDRKNNMKDDENDVEKVGDCRKNNKRNRKDRKNKHLRLVGKREEEDDCKGAPRYLIDLSVTVENTEEEIAKDLANKLLESKEDLLLKIVTIIGKEKSLNIFKDVKRIEKEGGMLIMNQSRRRTPGGIYLFLVKHEDSLNQEQREKIFEEDKERMKIEKRAQKKNRFPRNRRKNLSGKNIPELLIRGELGLEKINEERWIEEKGEIEHAEVENPPPTPETDFPDNSEDCADRTQDKILVDEISGRQTQEYDEDFLDLGGTNDMDLF